MFVHEEEQRIPLSHAEDELGWQQAPGWEGTVEALGRDIGLLSIGTAALWEAKHLSLSA